MTRSTALRPSFAPGLLAGLALLAGCRDATAPAAAAIGRCDGLPVERFDEYQAGTQPPHPWRCRLPGGATLALEAESESPFVGNRITGKGVTVTANGPGAGLSTAFPPPPPGRRWLAFDSACDGLGLVCTLEAGGAPLLTIARSADGQVSLAAPGQPAAAGRLAGPGWAHLALDLGADGSATVSAVQGRRENPPRVLATLPAARRPEPTGLAFASGEGSGRWRLDNLCLAGDATADRQGLWPFEQAPLEALRASPRKVFAYHFPIYGPGLGHEDPGLSWYQRIRLNPTWAAEAKPDRAEAGGELLYTPLPQPPRLGDRAGAAAAAAEAEVNLARQLGLDGFLVDFWAFPHATNGERTFQERSFALLDAAARLDPGFRILPAVYSSPGQSGIDGTGDQGRSAADYAASPILRRLADHPATLRLPDGRMALSMWLSENHTAAWWREVLERLAAQGIRAALIAQFNSVHRLAEFAPVATGMNHWGPRSPTPYDWIARARPHTGLVIQPICYQDIRTRGATWWESGASATGRGLWEQAIAQGADWAFIHSWSDYTEQAQAPSTAIGFALHDLNAYYTQWFKTGVRPPVVRDRLTWFHRRHHTQAPHRLGADWTLRQPSIPALDAIEVLAFLRAPAMVEVAFAGTTHRQEAPAGLTRLTVPLPAATAGVPVFRVVRDGTEILRGASRTAVLDRVEYRNPLWHGGSVDGIEEVP